MTGAERSQGDDADRVRLRRTAYDMKCGLAALHAELKGIDAEAARAVHQARLAAFETWTILATPFEEEEDH